MHAVLGCALGLTVVAPLGAEPGNDLDGDKLPLGAVARIGTTRLRHHKLSGFVVLSDGTVQTVGRDGCIRTWNLTTGRQTASAILAGEYGIGLAFEFSVDEKLVAGVGSDRVVIWDAATGREIKTLLRQRMHQSSPVFSPDGLKVALNDGKQFVLLDRLTERERLVPAPDRKGLPTSSCCLSLSQMTRPSSSAIPIEDCFV